MTWGLLALLCGAFPLFFWGGPDWVSPPLICAFWDLGHVAFFSVLLMFVQRFRAFDLPRQWLMISLICVVAGALIEFIQQFVGRDASAADVYRDLVGVWLGLFWGQRANRRIWIMRSLALLLTLPSAWQIMQAANAHWQAQRNFPLLAGFEDRAELLRLGGQGQFSADRHTQGQQSFKVTLDTVQYSGTGINKLLGDWRGYETLVMDIYIPDTEYLALVLRVSDFTHDRGDNDYYDRFNRQLVLVPGWNQVRIAVKDIEQAPRARAMNLAEISHLGLFAVALPSPRIFYWDNVRLE